MCGFLEPHQEPVLQIKMQVILNVVGVSQIVKLNLHENTIARLLPFNAIKESFKQNTEEEVFLI